MGETLNGVVGLDIDSEKKLVDQTLSSLKASDVPEKDIRIRMKNLGDQRYDRITKTHNTLHMHV